MLKSISNNWKIMLVLVVGVVLFSSCSRGGYGCPYELEAATDVLKSVIIK